MSRQEKISVKSSIKLLVTKHLGVINIRSIPLLTPGYAAAFLGTETSTEDASVWSGPTEAGEGLKVSQQMMDSLLLGAGTLIENEEYLMGISSRLQTALEKMLMTITDTTNQVKTNRSR